MLDWRSEAAVFACAVAKVILPASACTVFLTCTHPMRWTGTLRGWEEEERKRKSEGERAREREREREVKTAVNRGKEGR